MLSFGLFPVINKPSRITSTTETLIDNIFTNYDLAECKSALLYSDISDHLPIILQCRTKEISKSKLCQKSNERGVREFHLASIQKFKTYLHNADWDSILNVQEDSDSNSVY